jgi:hypothetical protein
MNNNRRKCKVCGKSDFEQNMHRTTIYDGNKNTWLCDECHKKIKRSKPAINRRKIICKDCANLDTEKCPFYTSNILNDLTDWCSRAERKEG